MPRGLQWNGSFVLDQIHNLVYRRLDAAAIYLRNSVKEEISLPGTVSSIRIVTNRAGVKRVRRGKTIYGAVRSKPGEPPRKQYGTLRMLYAHETDKRELKARVGTNYVIARFLEMGTSRMRPRPHLRRTLMRERTKLARIINVGAMPDKPFNPSWK